ncbi:MAG: ribonuclease D [Kiritimatiellia bacterium]
MIRNQVALKAVCDRLAEEGLASLDTEFVWRSTNRPILCLVQLGARDGSCWTVDCLTGLGVQPLAALLRNPDVVKVLHDAHQDLAHLFHWTGARPRTVFDTQLAAAFAGHAARTSLQKLLFEAIGVGLAKTETVTDWSQRPLTDAQVDYALDDVRYLARLRETLLAKADALGTRAWLDEELAAFDNPDLYGDIDPDDAWTRIACGRVRLDRRGFAILRAVAAVREVTAREWNLPKGWLGKDESLVAIAAEACDDPARIRFRHRLKTRGQRDLLAGFYATAVREALDLPEDDLPANPRPRYVAEVLDAADKALAFLRERAEALHVDPAVVANRATVTAWIDNPEDDLNPLARGWRFEVAGREMIERFGV